MRNDIGERLAQRRNECGLTQDKLCGQIGELSNGGWAPRWADISRIENRVRLVSDLELKLIARCLGCSAAWLLLGDDMADDAKLPHSAGR